MKSIPKNSTDQGTIFNEEKHTYQFDRVILVLVTIGGGAVCYVFDVFELMVRFTRMAEHSELDELIPALIILTLCLIWYSWRRRNELEKQIEKREELEKNLMELNHTLEDRIKDRTRDLMSMNTQLKQEIKRRKEAEEKRIYGEKLKSVIEMAGTICHEMNQPLQSISGNVELALMNPPEDPSAVKRFTNIKNQVDRMNEITKKLLRITAYQTKPYPGDVKIIEID